MTCINCSTEGEGKYCSQCSQPLLVKRLTFKEALKDFWARIYGFDGMFPRTFKDLTIRPGYASLEFVNGNRARYYGPAGYFFLMITCLLLLLSTLGLNFVDYMKALQAAVPVDQRETEFSRNARLFVADNIKLIAFVMIPVQAFWARYVFFRKQRFNFIEQSVLPLYLMGHWYWIQMVEVVVFYFTRWSMGALWQGLFMGLYMGFGYTTFITTQPKWKTFLKGLGIYYASFTVFIILTLITIAVIVILDPSLMEQLRPKKIK